MEKLQGRKMDGVGVDGARQKSKACRVATGTGGKMGDQRVGQR